jgi:hypothetical protein
MGRAATNDLSGATAQTEFVAAPAEVDSVQGQFVLESCRGVWCPFGWVECLLAQQAAQSIPDMPIFEQSIGGHAFEEYAGTKAANSSTSANKVRAWIETFCFWLEPCTVDILTCQQGELFLPMGQSPVILGLGPWAL